MNRKEDSIKRLLAPFLFTLIGSIEIPTLSSAAGSKLVEGDVLTMEGEFYTVHDTAGHEVCLHVDKTTHSEDGVFRVGDKLEADMTDKDHARYIYHVTQMQPARRMRMT